jgi:hypothetical protein
LCHKNPSGGVDFVGADRHYFIIPSGTNEISVKLLRKPHKKSSIVFDRLFKYTNRDLFGGDTNDVNKAKYGITTDMLLNCINSMDEPKKFDYTHVPAEDIKIDDPLLPVSMFDANHVYNKFTIPRAELRDAKPFDFSVVFVNNR